MYFDCKGDFPKVCGGIYREAMRAFVYVSRQHKYSFVMIAKSAAKNHSTIISNLDKAKSEMVCDKYFKEDVESIMNILENTAPDPSEIKRDRLDALRENLGVLLQRQTQITRSIEQFQKELNQALS